MTHAYAKEALTHFALNTPHIEFLRHNENLTYRVTDGDNAYLLRVHAACDGFDLGVLRAGRRTELARSEMCVLNYLNGALGAQMPVITRAGEYVARLEDDTAATLLTWRQGTTLKQAGITPEYARVAGRMASALFKRLRDMPCAPTRYVYDISTLPAIRAQIEKMNAAHMQRQSIVYALMRAIDELETRFISLHKSPELWGLVHADLSPDNILIHNGRATPIDFSLCGTSCAYMDLGGMLAALSEDFCIRRAAYEGYENEAGYSINQRDVEPFFALSVILFIACQHERFSGAEWFENALKRWAATIFTPLYENKRFMLL